MDFVDLIFMAIPEFIAAIYMIYIFIDKTINKKNIIYSGIIYCISVYFIRTNIPIPVSMIFINLVMLLLVYITSKCKPIECLLGTMKMLVIKGVLEFLFITIFNLIGISFEEILNNRMLEILVCNTSVICIVLINILLKKYKKENNTELLNINEVQMDKNIDHLIVLGSIVIIFILSTAMCLIYSLKKQHYTLNHIAIIFLLCTFIISISALMIIMIMYNKKKILSDLEKNVMENNLKQMEDSVDALRLQRHDYMNHLQILLMQVSKGKSEDARNYILSLCKDNDSLSTYYDTGSSYIDAILNTKIRRASKYNIELTACVDSSLECIELSDSELSTILLNIIDNAIDELKEDNKENKYIHVDVYEEQGFYHISIKNNGKKIEDINKIFEFKYSSKGDNRGYGLYSTKKILESYSCRIYVYSDEIETEFMIQAPILDKSMI